MSTQADLDLDINANLPSGSGITAAALRQVLHDMNAAIFESTPPTGTPVTGAVPIASGPTTTAWGTQFPAPMTFADLTQATNPATGSVVLAGGLGVGKAIWAGDVINSSVAGIVASLAGSVGGVALVGASSNHPTGLMANNVEQVRILTNGTLAAFSGITSGVNGGNGGQLQLNGPTSGLSLISTTATGQLRINSDALYQAQRATGTVSGTVSTTDIPLSLPTSCTVISVVAYTTTAFLATGTINFTAGTAAGDNAYVTNTNVKSIGIVTMTLQTGRIGNLVSMPAGAPNNFFIRLTQTGTPSGVGSVTVVVNYLAP